MRTCVRVLRRAPLPLGLLFPRRGVAPAGAGGSGCRPGPRGAGAHRPRRPTRGDGDGLRAQAARGAPDHRGRAHDGGRLAPHTAVRDAPGLLQPLPADHARPRGDQAPGGFWPCPASGDHLRRPRGARAGAGLPLGLRPRGGGGPGGGAGRPRRGGRGRPAPPADVRPRPPEDRAPASLRSQRPPAQSPARRARGPAGRAGGGNRQRARPQPRPHPFAGCARGGPPGQDPRRVRARAPRQLLPRPGPARGHGRALRRPPRRRGRDRAARGAAALRPHVGPRLRLPGRRGPRGGQQSSPRPAHTGSPSATRGGRPAPGRRPAWPRSCG